MHEKENYVWKYFMSDNYFEQFYQTDNDSDITGKYLFFDEKPEMLEKIAKEEIENNGFDLAKRNVELSGTQTEYVLCLYYKDDSRKHELAKKYKGKIKYRYWKSNEDTSKGKYSKEYLKNTGNPENS